MANEVSNTKVVTGVIRLSFAHIWEKWSGQANQEPRYSATILIPKTDKKTLSDIRAAIEVAHAAGKAKWGKHDAKKVKFPFRDGDEEKEGDENYSGHYFLNASSKSQPGIVNRKGQAILDADEVYSGCYCYVSLNFFDFDSNGSKGVGVGLNNIMKVKDGEKLAGKASAQEDFASLIDSDDSQETSDEDDDLLG
jgi:hypothetical protein